MVSDSRIYQDRVVIGPEILVGKPVIAVTCIPVTPILNLLAHGYDFAGIRTA